MQPDQNILTQLISSFLAILTSGSLNLVPSATKLLTILISIDFTLAFIFHLIQGDENGPVIPALLFTKIFKYGAFVFLVVGTTQSGYAQLVNQVQNSFIFLGLKAAGSSMTVNDFTNPSTIAKVGMDLAWGLLNIQPSPGAEITVSAKVIIFFSGLIIIIAFFVIAIRIFVLQVTFTIVAATGMILIPFGVWEPTAFIFDKIKNSIITYGMRYMFMSFVIAIVQTIASSWAVDPTVVITYQQASYILVGSLALAMLTIMAERVSTMMVAGSFKGVKQAITGAVNPIHNKIKGAMNRPAPQKEA